ncbi:hypothetical protein [Candidatus Paracaedibacter symbiosus]|uniref:hypothetical protein n=1 Tax=Candidatus Paracaedibacter symbiosus TaxID=244582 RepID=UPI0005098F80|nr:hypothetical protein [Candidatus Paracaedibacter symbiosus]
MMAGMGLFSREQYHHIVEITWGLVAKQGLRDLDADHIAKVALMPVAPLRTMLPDQVDIILLLITDILSKIKIVPNQTLTEQDRLFDVFMQGFDMAEPHKVAIQKLWYDLIWKPWVLWQALPPFHKKLDEMVESLTTSDGVLGQLLTDFGVRAVFFKTYLTWIDDETLDLSKTMSTLDQSLKQYYELRAYSPIYPI